MNKIARFLKTALIYFMGNMLAKLISLFLLPVYTKYISPDQYGTYDLVFSLINLISPVAFFQIWDGMFRFAFDYKKEEDKYKVISNAFVIYIFGFGIYLVSFCVARQIFGFGCFWLVLLYGFFFALQYLYTYVARVFLKNRLFVISGTVNTLITAVINIVLIVRFHWGIESLYLAPAIGCLVQILIIELCLQPLGRFTSSVIDKNLMGEMLRFSIPLCVSTVSFWLLQGFTKVIISTTLGLYENGLYAVANKFASMIILMVSVFQFAWNEMAYLMANDKDRSQLYSMCMDLIFKVTTYGSAAAFIVIKMVYPYMVNSQYQDSLLIIPAAVIGVSLNSVAGFLGTLFLTEKKTMFILYSTLFGALVNSVGGYYAALKYGLQGSVVVLAISFGVMMVLRIFKLKSMVNLKIDYRIVLHLIPLVTSVVVFYRTDSLIELVLFVILLAVLFIVSICGYLKTFIRQGLLSRKTSR